MIASLLYRDTLVEISEDSILFLNYYYPFGNKRVHFKDVDRLLVKVPSLRNGKYRYYGTGDFRTWFPPDARSSRDKIFVLIQKNKWWRVGFTVERSRDVLDVLKTKCSVVET